MWKVFFVIEYYKIDENKVKILLILVKLDISLIDSNIILYMLYNQFFIEIILDFLQDNDNHCLLYLKFFWILFKLITIRFFFRFVPLYYLE